VESSLVSVTELQELRKDAQTILARQIHPNQEPILTRLVDLEKHVKTNTIIYFIVRKLRDALR